ncbi:MAG: hypothetical protein QXJ18_02200 [Desulfurococcaceae archaeon]
MYTLLINNGYIDVDAAFRFVINQAKTCMVRHGHVLLSLESRESGGIVDSGRALGFRDER